MNIPGYRPYWSGKEIEYVADALNTGQISGDGYYTQRAAALLKESFDAGNVLMTTSGTHALEMAAILIGLRPGDEVIMPSFTFPSTACAVMLRGARPVFAEIREDTLNLDPDDLQRKISAQTRAVIPVHYAGIGCEMDKIMDLAARYKLYVIEDAAHAVNARFKGKYLGTWGHFGCYSFHGTKNYTCGEGGALLINLDDEQLLATAEEIRQKGTNRARFLRGDVQKYNWVNIGSSYTPSDILMAVLLAQLSEVERITLQRKAVWQYYFSRLKDYEEQGLFRMMHIPEGCEPNYHLFYVLFKQAAVRDQVMKELNSRGIAATLHFLPLHSSPMGRKLGYRPEDFKITARVGECLLRLPIYAGMTESELDYVVANFAEVIEGL